jgi:hypothetical protein
VRKIRNGRAAVRIQSPPSPERIKKRDWNFASLADRNALMQQPQARCLPHVSLAARIFLRTDPARRDSQ